MLGFVCFFFNLRHVIKRSHQLLPAVFQEIREELLKLRNPVSELTILKKLQNLD